jgi:hypothetical protein
VILNVLDRAVIGQGLNQPDRFVFDRAHGTSGLVFGQIAMMPAKRLSRILVSLPA